jgi:ABC-type Zn uptake system ZnuABC Zn-binding protein ZnuA
MLCSCTVQTEPAQIAATSLPVYEFATALCQGTDVTVTQLVTEPVSCLHDYTLNVRQVKALEAAELIILSGAGLEDFLEDALPADRQVIDSSAGIHLLGCDHHDHGHDHDHHVDPHIWLSPVNAKIMAENICGGLKKTYPQYQSQLDANLTVLLKKLDALQEYGEQALSQLSCRELITFHDGFAYLAQSFDLTILAAVEEESGREVSARELTELIHTVTAHQLPAIFTEINGSQSAAGIIGKKTGVKLYTLDMAMSGDSYFDAMYRNIDTLKEALG